MPRSNESDANRHLSSSSRPSDAVRRNRARRSATTPLLGRVNLRHFIDLVLFLVLAAVAWEILKAVWSTWT